jgi:ribonuclease BN (tRNA processing enzyme)
MAFSITVLGSAGMFQTRERAAAGYLLDINGEHLWLDAGAGTWRNLLDHIDYADLGGVLLTHRHPDHTTDVFQAFHARRHGPDGRLPMIPLWAPAETIQALLGFAGGLKESFSLIPVVAGDAIEFAGARISLFPMAHSGLETLGVRVEEGGGVFAYSSDTGPDADLATLARDADVFVCEATYQDSDAGAWDGHMSASAAASVAVGCGVKDLVLSHLPPGRDLQISLAEAGRNGGQMKVQLAEDGLRLEVSK